MRSGVFGSLGLLACLAFWACGELLAGAETAAQDPRANAADVPRLRRRQNEPASDRRFKRSWKGHRQPRSAPCRGRGSRVGGGRGAHGYFVSKANRLHAKTKIVCWFKDGTERDAEIVGESATHDLALLQVEATNLAALTLAQGDLPARKLS